MSDRLRALSLLVFVAGAAALAASVQTGSSSPAVRARTTPCHGPFRFRVKTLSDKRVRKVVYKARRARIATLRKLKRPRGITRRTMRLPGPERRTYRIQARLISVARFRDHDIRLVVSDLRSRKMAVVFPDPACDGAKRSRKRRQMAVAKASFTASCGLPAVGHRRRLRGSATITGIGFFDKKQKAFGNAPNGFQLHPVISFLGLCRPLKK